MVPGVARLLREWVALVAVLAMVLGPLALGVSGGLAASERLAIAAGIQGPLLCQPGGDAGGGNTGDGRSGGPDCTHCTPAHLAFLPAPLAALAIKSDGQPAVLPRPEPAAEPGAPRAPPARGPPVA